MLICANLPQINCRSSVLKNFLKKNNQIQFLDGYFFVGQGLNVSKDSGAKAAIRGRDSFDM